MSKTPKIGERTLYGRIVTEDDWPEDFSHENGNYERVCFFCDISFVGHKRRVACKKCATAGLSLDEAQVVYNLEDALEIIKDQ